MNLQTAQINAIEAREGATCRGLVTSAVAAILFDTQSPEPLDPPELELFNRLDNLPPEALDLLESFNRLDPLEPLDPPELELFNPLDQSPKSPKSESQPVSIFNRAIIVLTITLGSLGLIGYLCGWPFLSREDDTPLLKKTLDQIYKEMTVEVTRLVAHQPPLVDAKEELMSAQDHINDVYSAAARLRMEEADKFLEMDLRGKYDLAIRLYEDGKHIIETSNAIKKVDPEFWKELTCKLASTIQEKHYLQEDREYDAKHDDKDLDRVRKYAQEILEIDKTHAESMYLIVRACHRKGKYLQALPFLTKYVEYLETESRRRLRAFNFNKLKADEVLSVKFNNNNKLLKELEVVMTSSLEKRQLYNRLKVFVD